jgi:hypothetical protein
MPQNIENIVDKTAHLFSSLSQYFPSLPSLSGAYAAEIKDVSVGTIMAKDTASCDSSTRTVFDWKQRPEIVQKEIQGAFDAISGNTRSEWGLYNGAYEYEIAYVDEQKLIKTIIENAPPSQKDFYFMEIGAGNFQWEYSLSEFVKEQKLDQEGRHIHIIGLRGETNLDPEIVKESGCTVYQFGKFQIENLIDELEKRGLHLQSQVDAIVSRWTFRHLVDPLGTFVQAYNLLRPKTGHLMMDGFFFLTNNEEMKKSDPNIRMEKLLLDTKAPFLVVPFDNGRSLNQFILQKPDDLSLALPMRYLTCRRPGGRPIIGSDRVTVFDRTPQNHDEKILSREILNTIASDLYASDENYYYVLSVRGDRPLYERLAKNKIWGYADAFPNAPYWLPLVEAELPTKAQEDSSSQDSCKIFDNVTM